MTFGVLGPLEVRAGDGLVHVGGPQIRALLALLLVRPGHVISLSTLVASLWSNDAPPSAERTARTYMSRLRLALAPVAGRAEPGALIVTTPPGYLLRANPLSVDASLFEQLTLAGRRALTGDDPAEARVHLRSALGLWRGDAFAEFVDVPVLRAEASRLEELRLSAVENRLQSELRMGMGPDLVAELDGLVSAHPLRERLWVQFMIALYRSGRQAEALSAYQRARTLLADELGLEPSVELVETHRRILAQDPKLLPVTTAVLASSPVVATAARDRPAALAESSRAGQLAGRQIRVPWIEPGVPDAEDAERADADADAGPAVPRRAEPRSAEPRPAAAAVARALSQPCVRALVGELGRGLLALGRVVAALASVVSARVRARWGWGGNESLANMK